MLSPTEYQKVINDSNGAKEQIDKVYETLHLELSRCMEGGSLSFTYSFENIKIYVLRKALCLIIADLNKIGWKSCPIVFSNGRVTAELSVWTDKFNESISSNKNE